MDWAFHIGSCAMKVYPFYLVYFQIFTAMLQSPTDFMLWTGDHVYMLRASELASADSMRTAYLNQRKEPRLKKYMASRPQYAIWDDHDYGPNNSGADFYNKKVALQVFKEMWPTQPQASSEGIYFTFSHKEAQFFMLDCRYFKVNGKELLGKQQMDWLCDELKKSSAKFKFIVFSIQVISNGDFENLRRFPKEYEQLMSFLDKNKIEGVLFFSGDVHFSEISKLKRANAYDLYDITISPLTSFGTNYLSKNTYGIKNTKINKHNFGEVSFSGPDTNRLCTIKCRSQTGKEFWNFKITEKDLKY